MTRLASGVEHGASSVVVDLHCDSLLPHIQGKRNITQRSDTGHLDIPRMRQGRVSGQVFAIWVEPRDMTETSDVSDRVPRPILLDVSGRRVLNLQPGANDVRALAPGVYFVREAQAQAVRKIVITR